MSEPIWGDVTYSSLSQAVESIFAEDLLGSEAAMEAATTGNLTTGTENKQTMTSQAKKSNATDNAGNDMKDTTSNNPTMDYSKQSDDEFEKTSERIQRLTEQALKMLNNCWNANDTFLNDYSEMQNTYKLQNEITVINWSYGHNAEQYLLSKLTKFRAVINTNIGYITKADTAPEDALLLKKGQALDKGICETMGAPSSINSTKEFMGHLRSQFRGRKSEKSYRGDQAQGFVNDIRNFAKTKTTFNEHSQAAVRASKQLHSLASQVIKSQNTGDDEKRRAVQLQKNGDKMIITYCTMVNFCYRLMVEYILNRRLILQRLYKK